MNKKLLSILTALIVTGTAHATDDDFGLNLSVAAEKKLTQNFDFCVDGSFYTQDNSSSVERWGLGAEFGWKVYSNKKFTLKTTAGWEYMRQRKLGSKETKYEDNGVDVKGYNETFTHWRPKHRTSVSVAGTYKPNKRWSFSLRETVQYNHYAAVDSTGAKWRLNDDDEYYIKSYTSKDPKDRFVLRSRLTAAYNIKHCPLEPYLSADYGCGLNYSANKWKLTAGTDIKLNKQNKIKVFYRFQTEDDDDEPNGHIIGVGYNIKF